MVIDINNSINPAQPGKRNGGADASAQDKNAVGNQASTSESTTSTASDTVELSSQAQDLNRIREELAELPEVDESRVAQIRQQIADGSYSIDAEQIASKILLNDQNF